MGHSFDCYILWWAKLLFAFFFIGVCFLDRGLSNALSRSTMPAATLSWGLFAHVWFSCMYDEVGV